MDQKDFEEGFELLEGGKAKRPIGPLALSISKVRGGQLRLVISMSKEVYMTIDPQTFRALVAYSGQHHMLAVKHKKDGNLEVSKTGLGERYLLRLKVPSELVVREGMRELVTYYNNGKTLYIRVPNDWRPKLAYEPQKLLTTAKPLVKEEPKPEAPRFTVEEKGKPPTGRSALDQKMGIQDTRETGEERTRRLAEESKIRTAQIGEEGGNTTSRGTRLLTTRQ